MKNIDDKQNALKRMKIYKILMFVIDIAALIFLIFQIINKNINYTSYIILVLCNLVVFNFKIK